MKFPKYCKWCLICLLPVLILGIPLFIKQRFSWATAIVFLPALLCPIVMGIMMWNRCGDKSCEKEETRNDEGGKKDLS